MTNEAERKPPSNTQTEFSKRHRNAKVNQWSDESKNACVKVTSHSVQFDSLKPRFSEDTLFASD